MKEKTLSMAILLIVSLTVLSLLTNSVYCGFKRMKEGDLTLQRDSYTRVKYYIEQEILDKVGFKEAIDSAFKTWQNEAGTKNIKFEYAGKIDNDDKTYDRNDKYEVRLNSIDGPSNTLAITTILKIGTITGDIYEADICLDSEESWTTTGEAGKIDVQTIMLHEVGHLMGLDDVSDENQWKNEGIIMYYKYDREGAGVDHDLGKGDRDGLKAIYGTLENETGVGGIVIPVDKLALLAPYIGFASTIIVATVATAVYVKRVKRRKEKQ